MAAIVEARGRTAAIGKVLEIALLISDSFFSFGGSA